MTFSITSQLFDSCSLDLLAFRRKEDAATGRSDEKELTAICL